MQRLPVVKPLFVATAGLPACNRCLDYFRLYSVQHEEQVRAPHTTPTTQQVENPPITPDTSTGEGSHTSDGRSSQTTSAALAPDNFKSLVHKLFSIYECRSLEQQRKLIAEFYDEGAIYENNVALSNGRDALAKRFALLPLTTNRVSVEYDNPVLLGATASGPEILDNLADKGDVQVEVNNKQHYSFDRSHSMWRFLLLPQGDLELPVLTRLTLNREGNKVLYHRDIWVHHSKWWEPLQRCWGAVEKAAASSAGASAGATSQRV
eukprot:GHRR01001341.1.p1 GENE.GHRR01001341.1~~GHRR01001341.1.p1  ORF type:complete len:264 (+),score=77.96 GHRR01001341.1:358-1149(+)